ncbi:MAG: hypothetical protein M0R75_03960 [Dehalococcoidia bacterium]|nr:hypothetical protein [Dehalococcoidia bacterium]
MHLTIISNDPVQAHVLAGVAQRAGWNVSRASSIATGGSDHGRADAVLVDAECVGPTEQAALRQLAAQVGRERVFLLADQVAGVLPTPEDLGVHLMAIKPVHPAQFLRLVQASIPAAPASKLGRGIAGIGQTAAAMRA